ncbi:MAG: hypothetical protein QOF21_2018 [Actinomycetota bacterium]
MRGWIEWFARGLWKRRRAIQILLGFGVAFALLVVFANRDYLFDRRPARTMSDPAFERAAVAVCNEKIPPLRAQRREGNTDDDLENATAKAVDRAATRLAGVVTELRSLPVLPKYQSQVEAWFGHFDDFVTAGHDYADALRTGDENKYSAIDDEAIAPLEAISHFARANHIDACIP